MITTKLQNILLNIFNVILRVYLSIFITYRLPVVETLKGSCYFKSWGKQKVRFEILSVSVTFRVKWVTLDILNTL